MRGMINRTIRVPKGLLQDLYAIRRKSGIKIPEIVRKCLNASEGVVTDGWECTTTAEDSMPIKVDIPECYAETSGKAIVSRINWHVQREIQKVLEYSVYQPKEKPGTYIMGEAE